MKTALKNNFEKTLLVLLPIVMCMYARQTYAQMVNMTPYDSPVPDSLRLAPDGRMTKEQAIYDLNALVYTVSEVHPNMYAVLQSGRVHEPCERNRAGNARHSYACHLI